MASISVTISTNSDGSMTATSASSPGVNFTSFSTKAIADFVKGLAEQIFAPLQYPGTTS